MTVALAVKVWDGVVLATDSATTLQRPDGTAQVYNHANKTFQLHRDLPIGAMTWGMGNLGSASISSLAKDMRRRLMGLDENYLKWELKANYTIKEVAERLVEMLYESLYQPTLVEIAAEHEQVQTAIAAHYEGLGLPYEKILFEPTDFTLGFLIAGYPGDRLLGPELFKVEFNDLEQPPEVVPELVQEAGWSAYAQSQAVERLFTGIDPRLRTFLGEGDFKPGTDAVDLPTALGFIDTVPVVPAMPFQDAIHFARYLADVTIGYSRYTFGPDTVGGAVEVAGISRHEGFKWVDRKHYFNADLNPGRRNDEA